MNRLTPSAAVLLFYGASTIETVNGPVLKTCLIYAPQPHAMGHRRICARGRSQQHLFAAE